MDKINEIVSFDSNGHGLDANGDRIVIQKGSRKFVCTQDPFDVDKVVIVEIDID